MNKILTDSFPILFNNIKQPNGDTIVMRERVNQSTKEREACNDEGLGHLYHAFIACALLVENQEQEAEHETIQSPKVASRLIGACEVPMQSFQRNAKR